MSLFGSLRDFGESAVSVWFSNVFVRWLRLCVVGGKSLEMGEEWQSGEGTLGAARGGGGGGSGDGGGRLPVRRCASARADAVSAPIAALAFARRPAPNTTEMSHQITITRTTTTTSGTVMVLNTHYVKGWSGLLKLAETILAAVCVGIAGYYISHAYNGRLYSENPIFYFILAMFACLLATFSLLIACIVSMADATMLNKTLFECIYHFFAFLLTLSSSLYLLIEVSNKRKKYYYPEDAFLAAAVSVLLNKTVLHMITKDDLKS
ncbi:Uncharacterized protein GBIM_00730 [Gryllus bimaculatus]|nr:Uncharacterized protein GBIM_00730 [Gryllus bimaculatus]